MKYLFIWPIRFYQRFISPLLPRSCRFTPSCSEYALTAFRERNIFAAIILSTWRILRCNPFGRGGYDPVPKKGFRRVKDATKPNDDEQNREN